MACLQAAACSLALVEIEMPVARCQGYEFKGVHLDLLQKFADAVADLLSINICSSAAAKYVVRLAADSLKHDRRWSLQI